MVTRALVLAVTIAVQVLAVPIYISPSLQHSLKLKDSVDVFITLKDRPSSVFSRVNNLSFATREQRLNMLVTSLKQHASLSQEPVLDFLTTKSSVTVKSFWISNQVWVKNVDAKLLEVLAVREDIIEVTEVGSVPLEQSINSKAAQQICSNEWGIERIGAPEVWGKGNTGSRQNKLWGIVSTLTNSRIRMGALVHDQGVWAHAGWSGKGVLVANIDTGVRYTHQDLKENFVGEYGWFDPYFSTPTPDDRNGHGTHTMGIICGKNGIGVAPDASWTACRGCDNFSCTYATLLACGEFMICPTRANGTEPDCSKAPRLVSNSWGGSGGQTFYDDIVAAWDAAGIIGIFSNGGSGPKCSSIGSPADSGKTKVIAVGATTEQEELGKYSSLGPSVYNQIKPDLAAPGSDIRSAYNTNDESYATLSGTSMAAPHTAGVIALILSAHPDHDYEKVTEALYSGATQTVASTGGNCGGIPDTEYPNNYVGHGRLSAIGSLP